MKRTCSWCAVTDVYASTDERLTRAMTDHLKECKGETEDDATEQA